MSCHSTPPRGYATQNCWRSVSRRTQTGARRQAPLLTPRLSPRSTRSAGDQLIVFAFHDSKTLRETIEEAKALSLLVTTLYLD
eukprot:scaffold73812_cov27-Tisochrysis_lutea.AAC.2